MGVITEVDICRQLRIVEVVRRQVVLRARYVAIRAANAALLPATLERVFANGEAGG